MQDSDMQTTITLELASSRATTQERAARSANAAFGSAFTEHMVSMEWTAARGWHNGRLQPYQLVSIDPATVALHYGQAIFEGLQARRTTDGRVAVFRPYAHGERFQNSAARLMMPRLPTTAFVAAVDELVRADAEWVPAEPNRSLYLRPLMYASEAHLALRPAREYRFLILAFVTERFFGVPAPITVWVTEEYSRACQGGTGEEKYAGNYAASYAAQVSATEKGCDQVLWLDAKEHRWVEELGGMNIFFVSGKGQSSHLITPPLSGTILPGITRDAVLYMAPGLGLIVEERPMSIDELYESCRTGRVTEVFACGTAAQITSVGTIRTAKETWKPGGGQPGPIAEMLSNLLAGIYRGIIPDPAGWMHFV